jgi:hypothetical protein
VPYKCSILASHHTLEQAKAILEAPEGGGGTADTQRGLGFISLAIARLGRKAMTLPSRGLSLACQR